ncbi:hypothetical protein QMK19_41030 [Streptomyces sp. H10-C2]|uniref:hypothetical protein n=1 Tax=unclassified Streptomyces TaxID=2593676 RepID=UPI0024B97677|nr:MULTISPECIES: hypothetical protein [unclassified Streptomyces]MDJ0346814.1 hypothetical protein [Streptomyces sp. PH10-H1]MDJ0375783.1 hypothetical protein [Streptomyces sp. H10-C2]
MTATHVNGIAVVEDQPTKSGISRDGVQVTFTQTRHLLLADGTEIYGCQSCDYTSPNSLSIRPHLKVHKDRAPKSEKARPTGAPVSQPTSAVPSGSTRAASTLTGTDLASLNLGQLVERAHLTEQMRAQRDTARAETAAVRRELVDQKDRTATERSRREGWQNRAEKAEKKLLGMRALLQP